MRCLEMRHLRSVIAALSALILWMVPADRTEEGSRVWTCGSVYGGSNNNSNVCGHWIEALAIDPRTPTILYAGGPAGGVFKSLDRGATWFAASAGITSTGGINVYALAVDPRTPTTLYAGTEQGLFKSTDGAASWRA